MRRLVLLVTFATLTSFGLSEDVKQILNRRYSEVTTAVRDRKVDSIKDLLTKDYRAYAPNGQSIARDDVIKQFQVQANMMQDLHWPRKIDSLKVTGSTAIATVSGHLSAKTRGKQMHRIELIATTKDTWRRSSGQWLLAESHLLQSKMLMDGQPFNPGARH